MYTITQTSESNCKKFNCKQHVLEIAFGEVNKTFGEAQQEISQMFIDLHEKLLTLVQNNDYARITFIHNDFEHPIGIFTTDLV